MPLAYDMPLYRPPSEGRNLIIQATLGCSYNRCTFCAMYKTKTFTARPLDEVFADIEAAARAWPQAHRVFLADGDALVLPTDDLLRIIEKLRACFPNLARVSSYALPLNLLRKSVEELRRLREAGLALLYYGVESGSADILRRIRKGASPKGMIEGLEKAREAGMKVSATVILGLGGRRLWQEHIDGTVDLVNQAPLNFLSTLQLGVTEDTVKDFLEGFGEPFEPQDDDGMLAEQRRLIAGINPQRPVIFRSNHASNALPLAGTLPKDRDKLLQVLGAAAEGEVPLRPMYVRGY
jgi:coproporphyrinogen III oxidase-like Fe-S oxidoreductase